jgi:hypothetical protein
MSDRKIAICFFGITRSLPHTLPSIEANVLAPARTSGQVRVYAHLFRQDQIHNPRTGEIGALDPLEYQLLKADRLELEDPGACLERWDFETLKTHGDFWRNGFASLRNLVHQQHSLHRVSSMVLEDGDIDIAIFVRPDLRYHDTLADALQAALKAPAGTVFLPRWQPWFGHNDRFAIAVGRNAIAAYGQRAEDALNYCRDRAAPLHSERMLKYRLARQGIRVRKIEARASRVRANGDQAAEDFSRQLGMKAQYYAKAALAKVGLKAVVKRLLRKGIAG